MNRRRHTRNPISLSALVHPAQGRSWLCSIRDFCEQGMLLSGSGATRTLAAAGASPRRGDPIAVHFAVPTPNGPRHFRTQATIARLLDSGNGIGVLFDQGMPQPAFQALIDYGVASGVVTGAREADAEAESANGTVAREVRAGEVRAQPSAAPSADAAPLQRDGHALDEATAAEVRAKVRRVLERSVDRLGDGFFKIALPELLVSARDAGTNAVQMMYIEGLGQLEKNQERIKRSLSVEVLRQLDQVSELEQVLERRRRRETGETAKLQLVDTEQFEEWLAVAEIISKAENRHSDQLLDLRAQLGLLARPWTHKDANPVGPAVITWAFDDACKHLDLRRQVRHDTMRYFEQALLPTLNSLYSALRQLLDDTAAMPRAEELRESLVAGTVRRSPSGVRLDPAAYVSMDSATREAAMAADAFGGATGRADYDPYQAPAARPGGAYAAARSLLSIGRQTAASVVNGDAGLLAPAGADAAETFRSDDILDALSEIAAELGDAPLTDQRLKPRLLEILKARHGGGKALRPEDYDKLGVVESLVQSLEADHYLTGGIRDWIRRLEVTLNKLATRDPHFLDHQPEQPHSAVTMLNQLARLGNSQDVREGIDREVGRRVDELLQRVVSDYDSNPGVFAEVVDELNPLVDRQVQTYRGNVERTVRASEGQQKLARARRAVLREMEQRIAGREVPELVLGLLNPGWRNLLVHTHLRRGPDSSEWLDQLALFDQLHGQLDGDIQSDDAGYVDPEVVLKRIVEALNSISFDPSKRTPLIMALSDVLIGDAAGVRAANRKMSVPPGGAAAALGLDGLLQDLDPQIDDEDESIRRSWRKAVQRARRVQVGDWLATSDRQGRPLILTVAFVGDESSSFVLVNRKGMKAREVPLQELASGLHEGRVTLLDDFDMPLMERASQRMLDSLHHQLAHQAAHDELTQLLNRRAFERAVAEAAKIARSGQQHALLYLDLDQFKIINNTSGHTAGDELLKVIAATLTSNFSGERVRLARLGGDEFGILAEDIGTVRARELADDVLAAVRNQRFEWEGRKYTLTASLGLVFIDRSTAGVDEVMQFADEACYAAKDAGRNRVQEYELGDAAIRNRHGIMEWVTELDRALAEERLVLNCQRIAPASGGASLDAHYEILLTMANEAGEIMAPADFILAAETYQRMTAIDRWVIERVFQWMSDHRAQLDGFGGFAINVSGHSINDEGFSDFVLEQFARTQAPTSKVCFEITETAAIASLENAREFMNRMKIIGCRFSLDDFGTGLSSYSYLRNLPVDYVKIDGVFVKDMAEHPGDYAVVRSINEIGHYMGKQTIAECVESDAVLEGLREIGVDFVQGYHIDKPCRLEQLRL
ncbi:MAG: DUF1631 family protein [Pseudomonadales bacterium]